MRVLLLPSRYLLYLGALPVSILGEYSQVFKNSITCAFGAHLLAHGLFIGVHFHSLTLSSVRLLQHVICHVSNYRKSSGYCYNNASLATMPLMR